MPNLQAFLALSKEIKVSGKRRFVPAELFDFGYFAPKEELLNEMVEEMSKNEKLLRLMYQFFNSIKFVVKN